MDLGLKDRVYVVTGASRGLGHASARALVADGAKVVVSSRDEKAVARAAEELGAGAVGVAADNADPAAADRLIGAARTHFGRFDGVLISVGGPAPGWAADNTDEQWQAAFDSVFLGAVRMARAAAAALPEGGVIGFVLSGSVYEPIPGLTISNGLRPGLAGFAKSLADELGPRGIRVVGLLPGRIDTDRVRELDALSGDAAAARADSESRIPLRRYGTPEEFGNTAAFLLSPAASYLTGVMVPVDGGARHGF
ncbi:oxidoreductase [Streptomyces sp. CB03234]|uniref:SDR family oxidoreductase n=1 Tax=Streptomyces sp. (strain CB03234) TaxID=1703937 RepID=UPI00093DEDED|nr:SDR family oxidoreductase [Streptomyces sp. CB03234]OKK08598.1 oxidoreductase [Streptomyces sp. CB03234]